jgi:hypothetical protein
LKANFAGMFHWWPFTNILFSSNMTAMAGNSFNIKPYGKMNKIVFLKNWNLLESILFMNDHCMVLYRVRVMVFNAPFNTISAISWRLVFIGGENHRPAASHWLSHNVVSSTPRLSGSRTHNVNGDRYWLHR